MTADKPSIDRTSPCAVHPLNSRCCELGTRGCETTHDTRPSIGGLRTVSDWCTDADLDDWAARLGPAARPDMMVGALIAEVKRHRSAAPVLLEIAAAALGLGERFDFSPEARQWFDPEMRRLIDALDKVRP